MVRGLDVGARIITSIVCGDTGRRWYVVPSGVHYRMWS